MHYFRGNFETITKGDGSPVTIADRGIEQTMRVWIAARLPDHGIFGEQSQHLLELRTSLPSADYMALSQDLYCAGRFIGQ